MATQSVTRRFKLRSLEATIRKSDPALVGQGLGGLIAQSPPDRRLDLMILAAATLLFAIEVKNRKHLADVIRRVRRTGVVSGVYRYPL